MLPAAFSSSSVIVLSAKSSQTGLDLDAMSSAVLGLCCRVPFFLLAYSLFRLALFHVSRSCSLLSLTIASRF